MGFIIGLLTFIMVLDCLVLVFLVLLQLPKKEAGMGLAFGGAATDALFGAGSGTVLTKITKYAAGVFFVLAVGLSIMQSHRSRGAAEFQRQLQQAGSATAPFPSTPAPAAAPGAATASTNLLSIPTPAAPTTASNLLSVPAPATPAMPAAPASNGPAAPARQE